MSDVKFICAQPAIDYYTWQVEVMIQNFMSKGVSPNNIEIVSSYTDSIPEAWLKLAEHYNYVRFFFYPDKRFKPSYVSSVRPHILYQHWLAHPELADATIFYHDCDICLSRPLDLQQLMQDEVCYVSDTVSYIGAAYISSKGEHYLDMMCDLVGINKDFVIEHELDSGGAQYLIKKVPADFWLKVYHDAENLFRIITKQIAKDKPDHALQIWCADMWAVLWNLWFYDKTVKVTPELSFSWGTSHISEWFKHPIYHNAGVTTNAQMFYKSDYMHKLPYWMPMEHLSDQYCVFNYARIVVNTRTIFEPPGPKKLGIFYTNNNVDSVIRESLLSLEKFKGKADILTCTWRPIADNPFEEVRAISQTPSHLNIITQILQLLYKAREKKQYDYVSFLEHDVLYPTGYFDYPDFSEGALVNTNFMGLCDKGWQQRTTDFQLPLHQMTMRFDDAIQHFEKLMLKAIQQGSVEVEPLTKQVTWSCAHPAVHINHGKHFTSHFTIYNNQSFTAHDTYWGTAESWIQKLF